MASAWEVSRTDRRLLLYNPWSGLRWRSRCFRWWMYLLCLSNREDVQLAPDFSFPVWTEVTVEISIRIQWRQIQTPSSLLIWATPCSSSYLFSHPTSSAARSPSLGSVVISDEGNMMLSSHVWCFFGSLSASCRFSGVTTSYFICVCVWGMHVWVQHSSNILMKTPAVKIDSWDR